MKKTFNLTHEKIKYPRLIESVKSEVRKCIKRNRRRELPKGVDFWDFECKFGVTESEAKEVHLAEIDKHINEAEKKELKSFYIEILPTNGHRQKKFRQNK
ncbi:MAG: hypothetical protein HN548_00350 [Opitutae bacterium]|jgi:hypothetical protein|nr:hypothetical protein [Opitutae bacterium]MBT5716313.1 hypothetical protein [Opitutae bacterium]